MANAFPFLNKLSIAQQGLGWSTFNEFDKKKQAESKNNWAGSYLSPELEQPLYSQMENQVTEQVDKVIERQNTKNSVIASLAPLRTLTLEIHKAAKSTVLDIRAKRTKALEEMLSKPIEYRREQTRRVLELEAQEEEEYNDLLAEDIANVGATENDNNDKAASKNENKDGAKIAENTTSSCCANKCPLLDKSTEKKKNELNERSKHFLAYGVGIV